jgi:hypothetical protein
MHAQIKTKVATGGVGAAPNLDDDLTWKPGSLAQLLELLKDLNIEGVGADDAERGGGIRIVMGNHADHHEAKRRLNDSQLMGDDGHGVVVPMANEPGELARKLSQLAGWGYLVDGLVVLASHTADGRVRVSIGTTKAVSREHREEIGAEPYEDEESAAAA